MPVQRFPPRGGILFIFLILSILLVVLSLAFHDIGNWREGFIVGAVATLVSALFVFTRRVGKERELAGELLAEALERHGSGETRGGEDLLVTAQAIRNRLDLYKDQLENTLRDGQAETERRVQALTSANKNLLTHHRLTKRMLQSLNFDEVFKTLLDGVRDRLGFSEAVVGIREGKEGDLFFRNGQFVEDASPVRISCVAPGSLLARTFWNGVNVFVNSLEGQENSPEDRRVLGDGPAFLVPLIHEGEMELTEARECGLPPEGALFSGDTRCWVRRTAKTGNLSPDDCQRARKACLDCPLFGPVALLVVRSSQESGAVTREAMNPIVSLAKEAELAMKVVGLHHNLRTMAVTDGLTGLYNHREFYHALRKELERGRRYRHTVSLLMIDVDDFKRFNDRFGHPAGDQALREVADLLRSCARATDIVARYGGEEFSIILPESTAGGALMLAERIRTVVAEHPFLAERPEGDGQYLSVSIGIYSCHGGTDSEDQMVAMADEAAYKAKNGGKNRVVVRETSDITN